MALLRPLLPLALWASLTLASTAAAVPTIWTGPDVVFTKDAFADATQPGNQDFLTSNVIFTRSNDAGLFNFANESVFQGRGRSATSPTGTEWAFGSAADFASLTFLPWALLANGQPFLLVDQDVVVHLIEDDIYLDLRFTRWDNGRTDPGGAFSYVRSSPAPIPEPGTGALLGLGLAALAARRRA